MNCTSCRYSQVDHADDEGFDDGPLLRCHRYPPQVFSDGDDVVQTWPNVGPDDWCGEYDPATAEAVRYLKHGIDGVLCARCGHLLAGLGLEGDDAQ